MSKELTWLSMLLAEGCLNLLEYLKTNRNGQFKELAKLKNKRTGKTFSPNTISARLDDLEEMGAIRTTALKTDRKRVLAYEITEKGLAILDLAYYFEQKLNGIISKDARDIHDRP
ncbi:hypothetical protein HZC07_04470 [Candidatus Micrarchaeota archaeon]|nr:hypothetical protein [Candidatus Micrarchaeota archaeon]